MGLTKDFQHIGAHHAFLLRGNGMVDFGEDPLVMGTLPDFLFGPSNWKRLVEKINQSAKETLGKPFYSLRKNRRTDLYRLHRHLLDFCNEAEETKPAEFLLFLQNLSSRSDTETERLSALLKSLLEKGKRMPKKPVADPTVAR
jgi:hypothetical protein